jgi:hypothetical protein
MNRSKIAICGLLLSATLVGWQAPAIALDHLLGEDSVDCTGGCGEIRWEDYSKYDGARGWAKDKWNAVGHISLGPDDASSVADLEFRDFSDCSAGAYDAYWDGRPGADLIALNTCKKDPLVGYDRESILVHELGHALKIADHPNDRSTSQYWRERAIMYFDAAGTNYNTPQPHDKDDHNEAW